MGPKTWLAMTPPCAQHPLSDIFVVSGPRMGCYKNTFSAVFRTAQGADMHSASGTDAVPVPTITSVCLLVWNIGSAGYVLAQFSTVRLSSVVQAFATLPGQKWARHTKRPPVFSVAQ